MSNCFVFPQNESDSGYGPGQTCVCIPLGDCYVVDYSFKLPIPSGARQSTYLVTLTVTNNAGLVTNETIEVGSKHIIICFKSGLV